MRDYPAQSVPSSCLTRMLAFGIIQAPGALTPSLQFWQRLRPTLSLFEKVGAIVHPRYPQFAGTGKMYLCVGVEMTRKILSVLFFSVGLVLVTVMLVNLTKRREAISVEKAFELIRADTTVVVLDVRTEDEYRSETGHLAAAKLIPIQQLEARIHELDVWKQKRIIVYCRTGNRSERGVSILRGKGFSVVNMEGGIMKWRQLGLQVVMENKP